MSRISLCHAFPCVKQVATTAYHNELIVLWGLSKSSKDLASLATQCAEKLLHRFVPTEYCALLMIKSLPQLLVPICYSLSEEIDDQILLPYALMVVLAPMTAAEKPRRPPGLQVSS